jgi:hypothetical protein
MVCRPKKDLPPIVIYPRPDYFQLQPAELDRLLAPFERRSATRDTAEEIAKLLKTNGYLVISSTVVDDQIRVELVDRVYWLGKSA